MDAKMDAGGSSRVVKLLDASTWKLKDHMNGGTKKAAPASSDAHAKSKLPDGKIQFTLGAKSALPPHNPNNPNFAPRKAWPESKLKVSLPKTFDPTRNRFEQLAEKRKADEAAKKAEAAKAQQQRRGGGRGRGGGGRGGGGRGGGGGGGGIFSRLAGATSDGVAALLRRDGAPDKKRKLGGAGGGGAPKAKAARAAEPDLTAKLGMSLDSLTKKARA